MSEHHSSTRADHPRARRGRELPPPEDPSGNAPFPVWAPVLIMFGVMFTGIVLTWGAQGIPMSYFVLFAVAMLVCTMFVDPRGLFLTIAAFPLYFFVGTFVVILLASPSGLTGAQGKARLATAVYPTIEHFLWLGVPFLACLIIGVVRWWLYRERLDRERARATQRRQWQSQADQSNRELAAQARRVVSAPSPDSPPLADPASSVSDAIWPTPNHDALRADPFGAPRPEPAFRENHDSILGGAQRSSSPLPRPVNPATSPDFQHPRSSENPRPAMFEDSKRRRDAPTFFLDEE